MTDHLLQRRLQLKPGQKALILNAPEGYVESLGPLPDGVTLVDGPAGTLDAMPANRIRSPVTAPACCRWKNYWQS
jgi:hypothetical protein